MATAVVVARPVDTQVAPLLKRRYTPLVLMVIGGTLVVGLLTTNTSPPAVGLLLALVLVAPWVIVQPVRGLQMLLAAAVVIEMYPLMFPDSFTDRILFWQNLGNSGLNGVSASPAELLMGVVLVAAFARAGPQVRARVIKGRMSVPYLIFLGAVIMGEVHGMLNGGDLNKSLWELRPQVYGFIAFVAASLLIRNREDIVTLAVIVAAGIFVKAVVGDIRYFIVLNHNLGAHETVLGHEDSFFLALMPMGIVALLIWNGWSRHVAFLGVACVVVMAALLANERRAGIAALIGGITTIAVLAIRYNARRRRRVLVFTILAAVAATAFLIAFWNDQYGLIGQLVRPIRSQFDPTYRDYLSNIYRQAENVNLQLSFQTNKVIGMGFGMPFLTVLTQADISYIYPLWNYIPHNTLLWVGVRMGLVGSIAFWGLFGVALLEVCRAMSVQKDRLVLLIVSIAGGAIVSQILVAYADLQLESYRNMFFIGTVFGLLNVLPFLFPEPAERKTTHA